MDLVKTENAILLAQLEAKAESLQASCVALALYENVLESTPDGIIVVDHEGKIEFSNLAAEEMFGYHKNELTNKDVSTLVPDSFQIEHSIHRKNFMANSSRR